MAALQGTSRPFGMLCRVAASAVCNTDWAHTNELWAELRHAMFESLELAVQAVGVGAQAALEHLRGKASREPRTGVTRYNAITSTLSAYGYTDVDQDVEEQIARAVPRSTREYLRAWEERLASAMVSDDAALAHLVAATNIGQQGRSLSAMGAERIAKKVAAAAMAALNPALESGVPLDALSKWTDVRTCSSAIGRQKIIFTGGDIRGWGAVMEILIDDVEEGISSLQALAPCTNAPSKQAGPGDAVISWLRAKAMARAHEHELSRTKVQALVNGTSGAQFFKDLRAAFGAPTRTGAVREKVRAYLAAGRWSRQRQATLDLPRGERGEPPGRRRVNYRLSTLLGVEVQTELALALRAPNVATALFKTDIEVKASVFDTAGIRKQPLDFLQMALALQELAASGARAAADAAGQRAAGAVRQRKLNPRRRRRARRKVARARRRAERTAPAPTAASSGARASPGEAGSDAATARKSAKAPMRPFCVFPECVRGGAFFAVNDQVANVLWSDFREAYPTLVSILEAARKAAGLPPRPSLRCMFYNCRRPLRAPNRPYSWSMSSVRVDGAQIRCLFWAWVSVGDQAECNPGVDILHQQLNRQMEHRLLYAKELPEWVANKREPLTKLQVSSLPRPFPSPHLHKPGGTLQRPRLTAPPNRHTQGITSIPKLREALAKRYNGDRAALLRELRLLAIGCDPGIAAIVTAIARLVDADFDLAQLQRLERCEGEVTYVDPALALELLAATLDMDTLREAAEAEAAAEEEEEEVEEEEEAKEAEEEEELFMPEGATALPGDEPGEAEEGDGDGDGDGCGGCSNDGGGSGGGGEAEATAGAEVSGGDDDGEDVTRSRAGAATRKALEVARAAEEGGEHGVLDALERAVRLRVGADRESLGFYRLDNHGGPKPAQLLKGLIEFQRKERRWRHLVGIDKAWNEQAQLGSVRSATWQTQLALMGMELRHFELHIKYYTGRASISDGGAVRFSTKLGYLLRLRRRLHIQKMRFVAAVGRRLGFLPGRGRRDRTVQIEQYVREHFDEVAASMFPDMPVGQRPTWATRATPHGQLVCSRLGYLARRAFPAPAQHERRSSPASEEGAGGSGAGEGEDAATEAARTRAVLAAQVTAVGEGQSLAEMTYPLRYKVDAVPAPATQPQSAAECSGDVGRGDAGEGGARPQAQPCTTQRRVNARGGSSAGAGGGVCTRSQARRCTHRSLQDRLRAHIASRAIASGRPPARLPRAPGGASCCGGHHAGGCTHEGRSSGGDVEECKEGDEPPIMRIVFLGDGAFSHTIRGYAPASHRPAARWLAMQGRVLVVLVDEFRTSKCCFVCGTPVTQAKDGSRVVHCATCAASQDPVRRLLAYRDRDLNGAANMLLLGLRALLFEEDGDVRPWPWRRTTSAEELQAKTSGRR